MMNVPYVTFPINKHSNHAVPCASFWILSTPLSISRQDIRVGEIHGLRKGANYVNAKAVEVFSTIIWHCRHGEGQSAQSYVSSLQIRPVLNQGWGPNRPKISVLQYWLPAIKSEWISHSDRIKWENLFRTEHMMLKWNNLNWWYLIEFMYNHWTICFKLVRIHIGIDPKLNIWGKRKAGRMYEPSVLWSHVSRLKCAAVRLGRIEE